MTTATFTALELNVLSQLAAEHGDNFNTEYDWDGNPYPHIDTFIYAKDLNGDQKQIRGALSSLLKKDAIEQIESVDEYDRFAWIFAINYKTFNQIREAA